MIKKFTGGVIRFRIMIMLIVSILTVPAAILLAKEWTFICDTDNCDVHFYQGDEGWHLRITCADGDHGDWRGDGIYGGTITCNP